MRRWEYKSINDECTTSLSWVTQSRTQCDAGGAPGCAVRRRRCRLCQNEKFLSEKVKCIAEEVRKRMRDQKLQRR